MNRHATVVQKPNPPLLPHRSLRLSLPLLPRLPPVGAKRKMMSSSMADPIFSAAVITVSDSCSRGEREDRSGPAVAKLLEDLKFAIAAREIVPDEKIQVQNLLIKLAREVRLVVTTGGTGLAPRDVTPEATRAVCERILDGVAERMRGEGAKKTPFAALSRGVCGVRGTALILNLPGSPAGAMESLQAVADLIPHALELLSGKTAH
jgi:molybdenum cofactor synthesis domain-containing protein